MSTEIPPSRPQSEALQILATEHWSLLATRALTYQESLGRVNMFLAILSGAVIALALVAQADHFGPAFISIAIFMLSVVLVTGVFTIARLMSLNPRRFPMGPGDEPPTTRIPGAAPRARSEFHDQPLRRLTRRSADSRHRHHRCRSAGVDVPRPADAAGRAIRDRGIGRRRDRRPGRGRFRGTAGGRPALRHGGVCGGGGSDGGLGPPFGAAIEPGPTGSIPLAVKIVALTAPGRAIVRVHR